MASVANIGQLSQLSQQVGVPDGLEAWKRDMEDYLDKKRNFQGVPVPNKKVTHKFIKEQDALYNPITQVYNNKETESMVKR